MKVIAILPSYSTAFLTLLTSSVLDITAQFLPLDILWSLVKVQNQIRRNLIIICLCLWKEDQSENFSEARGSKRCVSNYLYINMLCLPFHQVIIWLKKLFLAETRHDKHRFIGFVLGGNAVGSFYSDLKPFGKVARKVSKGQPPITVLSFGYMMYTLSLYS